MKREENYDLLRIVSAIAAIVIYVSSIWFGDARTDIEENELSITDIQFLRTRSTAGRQEEWASPAVSSSAWFCSKAVKGLQHIIQVLLLFLILLYPISMLMCGKITHKNLKGSILTIP